MHHRCLTVTSMQSAPLHKAVLFHLNLHPVSCRPATVENAMVTFLNATRVVTLLLDHLEEAISRGASTAFHPVIHTALQTLLDAGLVIAYCEGSTHIEAVTKLRSAHLQGCLAQGCRR